jgi:hypothetical protein
MTIRTANDRKGRFMSQRTSRSSETNHHHAEAHVVSLIVDFASAFAGSRVSWRTAVTWAAITGGIIVAGGTIAILAYVRL